MKKGGMVNMAALKNTKLKQEDAYDTGIGTQFNAETNKRDEDEEMYVTIGKLCFINTHLWCLVILIYLLFNFQGEIY